MAHSLPYLCRGCGRVGSRLCAVNNRTAQLPADAGGSKGLRSALRTGSRVRTSAAGNLQGITSLPGYDTPFRRFLVFGSQIVSSSPLDTGFHPGLSDAVYPPPSFFGPETPPPGGSQALKYGSQCSASMAEGFA